MIADTHLLAIVISFGAAIAAASNKLFVRLGTEEGHTYDAVFVVIVVNVFTLVVPIAIRYYPNYGITQQSAVAFVAAGILGTLLGRVCLYTSIEKIGASRTSPLVSSHALVSAVLSAAVLGEALPLRHAVGIVLIVAGVMTIAWETNRENPEELSRNELLIGLSIPMGAAFAYGWEPIFANFGFAEGTPAPVGLAIKTVAAVLGFTAYLWWRGRIPTPDLRRGGDLRWFILAGIANTLFLLCYYVALSIAPVNIVVPIVVTQTLFVVVLSALFMPERLEHVSWRLVVATAVVVSGVFVISTS